MSHFAIFILYFNILGLSILGVDFYNFDGSMNTFDAEDFTCNAIGLVKIACKCSRQSWRPNPPSRPAYQGYEYKQGPA